MTLTPEERVRARKLASDLANSFGWGKTDRDQYWTSVYNSLVDLGKEHAPSLAEELATVKAQRDELLAAAKATVTMWDEPHPAFHVAKLRAAIERAEGK